jgi:hypothetical protein
MGSAAAVALAEAVIPEIIKLGVAEAPVIQAWIAGLNKLSDPARQDIDDATRDTARALIVELQAKIDAM